MKKSFVFGLCVLVLELVFAIDPQQAFSTFEGLDFRSPRRIFGVLHDVEEYSPLAPLMFWNKTYGGSSEDYVFSVVQKADYEDL